MSFGRQFETFPEERGGISGIFDLVVELEFAAENALIVAAVVADDNKALGLELRQGKFNLPD